MRKDPKGNTIPTTVETYMTLPRGEKTHEAQTHAAEELLAANPKIDRREFIMLSFACLIQPHIGKSIFAQN